MQWDPVQYLQFAAERGRPFHDLLARVGATEPEVVVDLGCGPGNLTRTLAARWPQAQVLGVDSSKEMIAEAEAEAEAEPEAGGRGPDGADGPTGQVRFEVGDLRDWAPAGPVDVLLSNATLQWVPEHLGLLPRLVDAVRAGGWLAFQVPANSADPSHTAMSEVATSRRWADAFENRDRARSAVEEPQTYLERLAGLGCIVDAWETTYLHVLTGPDAIVRWVSGTGLRPYLQALADDRDREEFVADYRRLVQRAYPERPWGTMLPFRRVFVVAQKAAA
jgi:trans-aconitate 2-methyltransferase